MKTPALKWLLFSVITLVSSLSGFSKGFKYTSVEGKMSINFPAEFKEETSSSENSKTVKISAVAADMNFYVSFDIHTTPLTDHENLANVGMAAFNDALGGKIEEQALWMVKKNRGVRASILLTAENVKLDYFAIIIGQIQYQLVAFAENDNWNQAAVDAFIKTFKVKK